MTVPHDNRRGSPRERFRNILSADREDDDNAEPRKPAVVNLPRIGAGSPRDKAEGDGPPSQPPNRGVALRSMMPTFWTVGSILSLAANLLLLILVFSNRTSSVAGLAGSGNATAILGVYSALQNLDQAHIRATIPVNTELKLDARIPIQTDTNITLAREVRVQGAHVTINTELFNIDAPASVTLPAGTVLDVRLDLSLPMQTSIPVAVAVPIDLAVSATELHSAILGMQAALRPLVCAASPGASLPNGETICP